MRKSSRQEAAAFFLDYLVRGTIQTREGRRHLEVIYDPSPYRIVVEMIKLAEVTRDDLLYDLGCGDGRIVITAARIAGVRGVGIDIDPRRIKESRAHAVYEGVADKAEFIEGDLYAAAIGEAAVVMLYLSPNANLRLRPKLLNELEPGARIVSYSHGMGSWRPDRSIRVNGEMLYRWTVPANVTGVWKWTLPVGGEQKRYRLRLQQRFQKIKGVLTSEYGEVLLHDTVISGSRLQMSIGPRHGERGMVRYDGQVCGNVIEGTIHEDTVPMGRVCLWSAARDPLTREPLDAYTQSG